MSISNSDIHWSNSASGPDVAWIERDGHFDGIDAGEGFQAFENLDIEHLEPMCRAEGKCDRQECSGLFPSNFKFCPDCCSNLKPLFAAKNRLWSFPGPDGDGLLNAETTEIRSVSDPIGMPAPDAADLTIFVAGSPRRLLAIDRVNSVVYAFNRQTERWRLFASKMHFDDSLPKWSWAVFAFDAGFAFAGAGGPVISRLNLVGTALDTRVLQTQIGNAVSGPGGLDGRVLFLCADSRSQLTITAYDPRRQEWSESVEVVGAPRLSGDDTIFAAPVSKSPTLFWAGRTGYVAVRSVGNDLEAIWRSWSDGFAPELQIRPIWAQQGLWQFGTNGRDLQFEKFALKGPPANREVHTTHLTAGECSFTSGMKIYATPWDENSSQAVGNGDSFLMPLCGLAGLSALVADCGFDPAQRRVNPGELLQAGASMRTARLLVRRTIGSSLELNRSLKIGSLFQLQAVVFDGRLLVYDTESGAFEAWRIE